MQNLSWIRTLLILAVLLIIIAVLVSSWSSPRKQIVVNKKPALSTAGKTDANMVLNNVAYSTTDEQNVKLWDLNAEHAQVFDKEQRVVLEDIEVFFYHEGKQYHILGKQGELHSVTRNITLTSAVTAEMPDKTRIMTESIVYDHAGRTISTDEPIRITRGTITMRGVGMMCNLDNEKVSIIGNVEVLGGK